MTCSHLVPVLLCVLLPLQGLAQASPPPLIPAPSTPEEVPAESQATASGEEGAPQGELIPRQWTPERSASSVQRIPLQAVGGTLLGAVGAIPGVVLMVKASGCDLCGTDSDVQLLTGLGVGVSGFMLGATLGIAGVGALMEDEGHFLATLGGTALGTLAGLGLGLLAGEAYQPLAVIPLVGCPIIGGIIGYQSAHKASEARGRSGSDSAVWLPVVGVSPSGGVIAGLAGRF